MQPCQPGCLQTVSKEQLDVAAYSYSYHFLHENNKTCQEIVNSFWGDEDVRTIMLRHRFEHHAISHVPSCFKKGCECRFLFPFRFHETTSIDAEELDHECKVPWHRFKDPEVVWLSPWTLLPKREMGCQYINTYNIACSDVFNCNTNIQIGDISQVYYSTLYGSKSTQKEDSERVQRILIAVMKRLLKIEEDIMLGKRNIHNANDEFTKSLCILLSGLRAATSRHVISATMAHLLVSMDGSRFQFSHSFGRLLVSQLEATLEGLPVDVRVRTTKINDKTYLWPDSSSEDYIHRPRSLEAMCSYEMAMKYTKVVKSKMAVKRSLDNEESDDNHVSHQEDGDDSIFDIPVDDDCKTGEAKHSFLISHPGHHFTTLSKLQNWVVPMMFYDGVRLCSIHKLRLHENDCDEITQEMREDYAKIALLMFYPLRKLGDIQFEGSYWKLFRRELTKFKRNEKTTMWLKGFEILQNIDHRQAMQNDIPKQTDYITKNTFNKLDTEGKSSNKIKPIDDIPHVTNVER